jgi:anti-sigma B factor antagonist
MASEEINIATDVVDGVGVVSVSGEVDLVTAEQLRHTLEEVIERSSDVVVDLARLSFIDSSGLSALVDAHRRAREAGGTLTIRNPTSMLRRLLEITHLETLLVVDSAPPATAATPDRA